MLIYPIALSASETITCAQDNVQLHISVNEETLPVTVDWRIHLIDNEEVFISGSGVFQKEVESADAFSSYDDNSAISYKNRRAVFVMGNDQSIYFPSCVF